MKSSFSYEDAGVNIDAGNALVENIKPIAAKTKREGLLNNIGGFGALFELPLDRYRQPVLVSGTDGVGTKLKLALELKQHQTIGIDLVAMCVNDLIVCGAEPLFFLDYYASAKLDVATATEVISGIGEGCQLAGAALIGGETAEMPGIYQDDDYDLAGFCVGIVEKDRIINGQAQANAGDILIALGSSGVHSNGYSLVRKILNASGAKLDSPFANSKTLGEMLLAPTRIYVKSLLSLLEQHTIHSIAHITGGGLPENLPRVLPDNLAANIDMASWQWPPIFQWLQKQGNVTESEMLRTFNCGIGMVLCVPAHDADACMKTLNLLGEQAWKLGHLEERLADEVPVQFHS